MAFRADEEAQKGLEYALNRLIPKEGSPEERKRARKVVLELIEELGPVIDAYPSWHPLVSCNNVTNYDIIMPGRECGYYGLDHTVYFAKGFVTCPYDGGKEILSSLETIRKNFNRPIYGRVLETKLYNDLATTVVVWCSMDDQLCPDGTIEKAQAIGMLLEREIPLWKNAQFAETWETMRPSFLGCPHGARSSLFINQESGQAMKTVWNAIIKTGIYGPLKD